MRSFLYRKNTLKKRMNRMRSKVLFPTSLTQLDLCPFFILLSWKYDCKWHDMRWSLFTFSSLSSFLAHVNLCFAILLILLKDFFSYGSKRALWLSNHSYILFLYSHSYILILIFLHPHLIFLHSYSYILTFTL